jgi:DNA-binding transcriptional ArsR family regulator
VPEELADKIKSIELTEEGKAPVKEYEFIEDPEREKELNDPVRITILAVLRAGIPDTQTTETVDKKTGDRIIREREVTRHALSVVEIVKQSAKLKDAEKITKNQVYHHLPKLMERGFLVKYGTVTTGDRKTDYYRRTAMGFVLTSTSLDIEGPKLKKKTREYIERMTKVFDLGLTDEQFEKFIELRYETYKMQLEGRSTVARKVRADVADKEVLQMFEFLVDMYALSNEKYIDLHREIAKLLFPK